MFDLADNVYYSKKLLLKSCESISSFWDPNQKSFIRNSISFDSFFPTATFHGLSALMECGYDFEKGEFTNLNLKTKSLVSLEDFLLIFKNNQSTNNNLWIKTILGKSSHTIDKAEKKDYTPRVAIVLERVLASLNESNHVDRVSKIEDNLKFARELIEGFCDLEKSDKFFPEPGISPLPLLNLALCIKYYNSLSKKLNLNDKFDRKTINNLNKLVLGHLNFHMARFNDDYEPSFDPISLTISLYSATILSPEIKYTSFFNSCLKVIVENQNSSGCWPAGVSISFSVTGDVVQLPSVQIATFITEAIVDNNLLIHFDRNRKDTLNIVLPALRRFAKYLEMTFQENIMVKGKELKGWSSDRIGRKDFVETWITGQSCRFLLRLWLIEKAVLRSSSIEKLGLLSFKGSGADPYDSELLWKKNIVEPDNITKPSQSIFEGYISPILNQKKTNDFISRPAKDKMSFIIFGPPGSGKTYFVEQLAESLDWPLIELSPGHFIKNGLELIESTTKEIFDLLSNINHAVVLFDECDELFRSRDEDQSQTRTILSFATASMLPKLQKLHDKGDIILVLGTNYLHRIDSAVRRPGRFDDIYLFDRPDFNSRKQHIKNYFSREDIDFKEEKIEALAKSTNFFNIKEIFKSCKFKEAIEDNTVEDYKNWCATTGLSELEEARFNDKIKDRIRKRWEITPEILEEWKKNQQSLKS